MELHPACARFRSGGGHDDRGVPVSGLPAEAGAAHPRTKAGTGLRDERCGLSPLMLFREHNEMPYVTNCLCVTASV